MVLLYITPLSRSTHHQTSLVVTGRLAAHLFSESLSPDRPACKMVTAGELRQAFPGLKGYHSCKGIIAGRSPNRKYRSYDEWRLKQPGIVAACRWNVLRKRVVLHNPVTIERNLEHVGTEAEA